MNQLVLQRLLRRAGPAGLAGALLTVLAIAGWFGLVQPETSHLNETLAQSQALQARLRASTHKVQDLAENPDEQLQRFYGFFPGTATVPDWLAVIDRAATREHLILQQGEYRVIRDRLGLLTRYQVALPIHGTYPQIANFIQRVLKEVPIAAIESLSFERQQVGDPQLDAKLRLILFFGRES